MYSMIIPFIKYRYPQWMINLKNGDNVYTFRDKFLLPRMLHSEIKKKLLN